MMYSDASSHSWMVADMPRLSRIGLRIWPRALPSPSACLSQQHPLERQSRRLMVMIKLVPLAHLCRQSIRAQRLMTANQVSEQQTR